VVLRDVDFDAVFRRLADRRIEEAIKERKFDNLRGMGQPIELEPMPADENVRMMWWALRIMRQNDFTPHEVLWRKALDKLREQLDSLSDESHLEHLVGKINGLVHRINTLGTNALNTGVAPIDLETQRARLRLRISVR
jgi:hypothetical protein